MFRPSHFETLYPQTTMLEGYTSIKHPTGKTSLNGILKNGTLQKWQMANASLEIEKYGTLKKCRLTKMIHNVKNA